MRHRRQSVARIGLLAVIVLSLCASVAPLAAAPATSTVPTGVEAAAWSGVQRWAGSDRYDTAVQISKLAFAGGADTVVVATGTNWPDALCAAPLCSVANASLLLVRPDSVPTGVINEISRLGATEVIILGGTGAVSNGVQNALTSRFGSVRRIAGVNRYETAAMIAEEVMASPGWNGTAFYATGANFPDALGASALAAARKMPILLSAPGYLPDATRGVDSSVGSGFIVGGTAAVGSSVESSLRSRMSVVRLSGSNRYETTKAIMDYAVSNWGTSVTQVGVASGANFPDALAAGVAMGALNQGQLLTAPATLASPTSVFLNGQRSQTNSVVVFGGTGAVAASVVNEIESLMWSASYSGSGPAAIGPFTLKSGLTVCSATHTGSSNFIVRLLDSGGHDVDLFANVIGDYNGSQATGVDSTGSYYMDVDADGPWSINLTQPRPAVPSLPYSSSFSGSGPKATSLFRLAPGARTFKFSYTGSSNFIVWLLDYDGQYVDLIANEIGSTSGSTVSGVEAGGYLLNVDAEGSWSVTIQ